MLVVQVHAKVRPPTCAPVPSNIVAWWPFDETTGTIAKDIVGSHNAAYVNNPRPALGNVGGALRFSGNYAAAGDSPDWFFNLRDFTIEGWMNMDRPTGGSLGHPSDIIVGSDDCGGFCNKWFFAIGGGYLNLHVNGPWYDFFPLAPFNPVVGQWHHVAITREGNNFTEYINGVASASVIRTGVIPDASAPLTIGQAEGIGFFAGRLDELSIYHRALSQQELQGIVTAGVSGKCKTVRIVTSSPLTIQTYQSASIPFVADNGVPPYKWSMNGGILPLGMNFDVAGVLSGTPTQIGKFTFKARVTDASNAFAEKDITIETLATLPRPGLRIYKTGTMAVPGREIDYFIVVENAGTTFAVNRNVIERVDPSVFQLLSVEPEGVANITEYINQSLIMWEVNLSPNERAILHYQARVLPSVPVNVDVIGGPACTDAEISQIATCMQNLYASVIGRCTACAIICTVISRACLVSPLACVGAAAGCGLCIIGCDNALKDMERACFKDVSASCTEHIQKTRASFDPNEKEAIANKYIQSGQRLPYVIHYENIGTADAQDIVVTDTLNPEYNISTVEIFVNNTFMPITDGQSIILFEQNKTKTINQTVGNQTFEFNISYFENHTVSLINNRLRWELSHIHLDPNMTDKVFMAVKPNEGLTNGTAVRNTAQIVFDINPPLLTNTTINIIDDVRPTCIITPLPSETFQRDVVLRWTGQDTTGEIESYTIFMNENNGPFVSIINSTEATTATVTTKGTESYSFMCLALDTAGNSELQSPNAETSTYVNLATVNRQGTPQLNQPITFKLKDPSQPNAQYLFILAASNTTGLALGDGRKIPLNYDTLFQFSLQYPGPIGLVNNIGRLDSNGEATVTWNIPNFQPLTQVTVSGTVLTYDANRPFPQLFTAIAPSTTFTIIP